MPSPIVVPTGASGAASPGVAAANPGVAAEFFVVNE